MIVPPGLEKREINQRIPDLVKLCRTTNPLKDLLKNDSWQKNTLTFSQKDGELSEFFCFTMLISSQGL